jgi:hypothetical protein
MVFTRTLLPLLPLPTHPQPRKEGNRKKGDKKDKKGKTQPKAKTGTPNTNLPRTSLSRPSKLNFYFHFHGWVTTHGWLSGNGGQRTSWRCVPVHEVSSFRVHPSHASCPYPRCRTQPPRLHQCPACCQCAPPPHCVPCFPPLGLVWPSLLCNPFP